MQKIGPAVFIIAFLIILFVDFVISKGHNCKTIEKIAKLTDSEEYVWMNKCYVLRMYLLGDIAFCPILGILCCVMRGLILLGFLVSFILCMFVQNVIIFFSCILILAALISLEMYVQNYVKLEIVGYYISERLRRNMKYHSDVTIVPFNVYDKTLENLIKEKEKEEEIQKEIAKKQKKCPMCGSYMNGYKCSVCGYKH